MPYVSKAQQRYFHAAEARGEISKKTVQEYDEATKHKKGGFAHLPESHSQHTKEDEHAKRYSHYQSHKK